MSKKKKRAPSAPASIPRKVSARPRPFPRNHPLAIGLMVAISLAVYANTLQVPFQFDDIPNISENSTIFLKSFSLQWLGQLIKVNYKESTRIFAYLTFALNYYFGGLNVLGYHLVNLLIHISSGLLLYGFLLLTFNLPSLKERYSLIAFPTALFSSLLFLCHPVQTQSVTYIVQRMASMAGLFYLLGMLFYVKGRLAFGRGRLLFWAGMTLSYLLGIFTKENVAILPLFIALYEFYFFQNLDLGPKGKKALLCSIGAVLLIVVLMVLFWGRRYIDVIIEGYQIRDFTLTERVLTQFRVVLYYVTLLLYPHPSRLNLDYDFPISKGILDPPTTLLSILIVAGLVGYAVVTARKRPLLSYFILWYFGNLIIESSIFPLEVVYEHRLYLPAIGPIVLFALLVIKGWEKGKKRLKSSERPILARRNLPLWLFLVALTLLLGYGAYQRNFVWKDRITLWEDCVKKSPNKPRTHYNLGCFLIEAKIFDKGVEELKTTLKLDPKYEGAHLNLGRAYGEMKLFDQAAFHFEQHLRLAPKDPKGYNEMGVIKFWKRNYDEAIQFFKKGLELDPNLYKLYANLGDAYLQTNRIDEAMVEFKKAIALNPADADIHAKMAEALAKKGLPGRAMEEIGKALSADPSSYGAHLLRGAAYVQEGRTDEGIAELKMALKFNSKDPKVYNNLGVAYQRKKMLDEAMANYRKAIDLDPSFSDARVNLGELYLEKGKVEEAISEFKNVIVSDPHKAEAHNNLGVIFLRQKKLGEAISNFDKALSINPKYGDAYFNLALAYYYKKDFPSASHYARKALELGSEVEPELLKALGISK